MKKIKAFLLALILSVLLFSLLSFSSVAYSDAESISEKKNDGAEKFVNEFSQIIPTESGITLDEDELIDSLGIDSIMKSILNSVTEKRSEMLVFFLTVIGFSLLCVVCDALSFSAQSAQKRICAGVLFVMSVTIYPSVYSVFESVRSSLSSVTSFFGAALPIMTAISTASGSVNTAGVQAMNMNVTLGIIGAVSTKLLLPLSLAMLALALVSSFGDGGAGKVAGGIRSIFTFGLGIVTAAASAAIALQTVIASAADSAALRAARYAAGGLIPVVGSSVSSALSTLAGGLAYVKSTVGAAAIGVVSVISMAPLISLLVYRCVFSVAISLLGYADNSVAIKCFSAYRTAFDAVISVYVMSTVVCIIQLIVFIKGGGSV